MGQGQESVFGTGTTASLWERGQELVKKTNFFAAFKTGFLLPPPPANTHFLSLSLSSIRVAGRGFDFIIQRGGGSKFSQQENVVFFTF